MKDRPHKRRPYREKNTLAVDVAGRFKEGIGPEGKRYKYMTVATFNAAKKKWNDADEEENEETEDEDVESPYKEVLVEEHQIVVKTVKVVTSQES